MAKKFFYVCAGFLLLSLAHQLGVNTAMAQLGSDGTVGHIDKYHDGGFGIVINRVLYYGNSDRAPGSTSRIPGTSPVVAIESGDRYVILANGDVLQFGSTWELRSNLVGGPISNQSPSWGQVKARYG